MKFGAGEFKKNFVTFVSFVEGKCFLSAVN